MSLIGTAAQWTAINPVLPAGDVGYETDSKKSKRGDGASPWTSLPYDGATYYTKGTAAFTEPNGATALSLDTVAAAVNYFRMTAGAAGSVVTLRTDGTDTNVGLVLRPKGSSGVTIVDGGNVTICSFVRVSSAVNYLQFTSAVTGAGPGILALGTDTNVDIQLVTKGTGFVKINGSPAGVKVAVPASATATGVLGQWAADASWHYMCIATNTWVRSAAATW